ncbi:MAG TPA: hypothetical protein VFG50_07160, partial [Rhodothermales bacterium]|nr:hypothetical protein [Rhodothermales bacterium]
MLKILLIAALLLWLLSRGKLWHRIFNFRRELRHSVRRRSFFQYYVTIRWRELAGLLGFILIAISTFQENALAFARQQWIRPLLYVLYAGIVFYAVYVVVDGIRLHRRFTLLVERMR